ncbi:hypothetical protein TRFO_20627 [Tritrichomonas foetus]|uniref:VPS9 domain-containing protein n=1 Tax=Tritrichomonas foetus TaxID=1144522 RepID=A0A1J4KG24_9EUKA|nr:hypothetical protein TRFO_20627 [Tritrichomonas foetus]|eukprot:OHT10163.1 hypothetical protein TRFO_20627 [Tritrichomonas foetus]
MSSVPDLHVLERFENWKSYIEDVLPHMSFRYPLHHEETNNEKKLFFASRNKQHQEYINRLNNLDRKCRTELYIQNKKLQRESNITKSPFLGYDDQRNNLKSRIYMFLTKKIVRLSMKYAENYSEFLRTKIRHISQMIPLFDRQIVPLQCVASIYDEFFSLEFDKKKYHKILALCTYRDFIGSQLKEATKPIWVNDFPAFLSKIIEEGKKIIDQELFYFEPLNSEISLSRYLFMHHSQEGRALDKFIASSASSKFEKFSDRVVSFCLAIVPKNLSTANQDQSIALLLLYRALMDRIYTTQNTYFHSSPNFSEFWKLSSKPISQFTIPQNMLVVNDPQEEIRKVFLRDPIFNEASKILTSAIFCSSPIDILYKIHMGMIEIHKAAISNIVKRDPTPEDLKQLLGFDDLFSLLLGTILASDVPDVTQIGKIMKLFAPKACLSPLLEYANANLEAIILHFQKD